MLLNQVTFSNYPLTTKTMSLISEEFDVSALYVMYEYDTEGMSTTQKDRLIVFHHYLARGCKLQEHQITEKVKELKLELEEKFQCRDAPAKNIR